MAKLGASSVCICQVVEKVAMRKSMNQKNADRGSLTTADKIIIGIFGACFAIALFTWLSLL